MPSLSSCLKKTDKFIQFCPKILKSKGSQLAKVYSLQILYKLRINYSHILNDTQSTCHITCWTNIFAIKIFVFFFSIGLGNLPSYRINDALFFPWSLNSNPISKWWGVKKCTSRTRSSWKRLESFRAFQEWNSIGILLNKSFH